MPPPRYSRWDLLYLASLSRAERVALPRRSGLGRRVRPILRPALALWRKHPNLVAEGAGACALLIYVAGLGLLMSMRDSLIQRAALVVFFAASCGGLTAWNRLKQRDPALLFLARARTRIARRPSTSEERAAEMNTRREVAVRVVSGGWARGLYPRLLKVLPVPMWLPALPVLGCMVIVLGHDPQPSAPWLILLVAFGPVVCFGVFIAAYQVYVRKALGSLKRAARCEACPDCGHDLATAAGQNGGMGPQHCAECGSPWPIVPPPLGERNSPPEAIQSPAGRNG